MIGQLVIQRVMLSRSTSDRSWLDQSETFDWVLCSGGLWIVSSARLGSSMRRPGYRPVGIDSYSIHAPIPGSTSSERPQGRDSSTRLNGVSVARRWRLNPASLMILASRASPAWAPSAGPSRASEQGTQSMVEAP
ncbi:MAG: hypothetical protein ACI82F_003102 [Planctomycetota bacterium]|jgi:hypothetical protein